MSASAIYEGWVSHRRLTAPRHGFRYRVWMPLLDLDELPRALDRHPLWSARRPAPVRIRREDFLGPRELPLDEAARRLVAERAGFRPDGAVRLLASPRVLGVGFNPVTVLFLHGEDDTLEAAVAEVTNTPWGERRSYVIADPAPGGVAASLAKGLHVSPFMPLEQRYEVAIAQPGEELTVSIASMEGRRRVFEAELRLRRHELTRERMTRVLLAYPPSTIATLARIYGNALKLLSRGAPRYAHPGAAPT
jgi:DUF1365 family protein